MKYAKYAYDIYANRKIILAVIGIIIAGAVLYPAESIDLHEHEFDGFDLDVPYGSDFKLSRNDSLAEYVNDGNHSDASRSFTLGVGLSDDTLNSTAKLVDVNGSVKVYNVNSTYAAFNKGDDANIIVWGDDREVVKKMAESFDDDDDFKNVYKQ